MSNERIEPMKVLVFSPYYPPHIGGLETHSDEFNKYLSQQGKDIIVFTPRLPESAPEQELRYGNVQIIRFPAFEIIRNYPMPKFWSLGFWRLFFSLFRMKHDFVVSRTRFFFSSFIALIYAKITRTRWIHIEHGSDFVKLSSRFKTLIAKCYDYTFGLLVFRCSDINISISEAVKKFIYTFDKRTSPVIYRGMDFEQLDAIMPDESFKQRYPGKIILGTVARLYKWKGVEYSIAAIRSLPEDVKSKIVFIIIGDGEDYDRLKVLSQDLPIEMLGNLPREKAIGLMRIFDIYIHSSFPGGGLSTSLLEAMYCECAVIATPNEGANEIVEHDKNGMLIGTPSTKEIMTAIEKLVQDKTKREIFSTTAKRNVRERFSWDTSIGKYLELFQTIRK